MDYNKLAERLFRSAHKLSKCDYQREIDRAIIGERFVLLYIRDCGSTILPKEISSKMQISTARVAAILKSLENKGLVSRKVDAYDRRRVLVELTTEGQKLALQQTEKAIRSIARHLESLGEDDAREYVRITEKLAANRRLGAAGDE